MAFKNTGAAAFPPYSGIRPAAGAGGLARAADEVIEGRWRDQFVVDALQGGAGTSTNMNVNEVLAARANELITGEKSGPVHPLDHVNLHQSTNDVYPTALRIAALWLLQPLSEACAALQESLQAKEAEFAGVIKVGRTQLQDALPIMLGQEFGAWAQAIARDRWRLYKVEERLRQTNLGGTAVGTGLNAPPKYIHAVNERVRRYANIGLAGPRIWSTLLRTPTCSSKYPAGQGPGGQPEQDRPRPAAAVFGPAGRAGGDTSPRTAGRLVDHARQSQPGYRRGCQPGGLSRHRL
jgi:fumarate hydratase class II